MNMSRRMLMPSIALAAGSARAAAAADASPGVTDAVARFAAIPATASCLIESGHPAKPWRAAHDAGKELFVGSAIKTFILARFLLDVEEGRLSEDRQLDVNDAVRSLVSPVFLHLTGTTAARSVLEAMIAHSDNTATDIAMAAVGPDRVRHLIAEAGLKKTRIPASTRRMISYLAGAPAGRDLGWDGMLAMEKGTQPGPSRPTINDTETMTSSAEDLVAWYRMALSERVFKTPEMRTEFRRIQAMANAIAVAIPPDTIAYAKGGSIDWEDFHCNCFAGQMIANALPVTFAFTINWTGPADGTKAVFEAFLASVRDALRAAAASSA